MSSPSTVAALAASRAAASAASAANAVTSDPAPPLTAEEMVVESQLVAVGILEARQVPAEGQQLQQPDMYGSADAVLPASRAVKAEIQRTIQTLISFVERAHGLRIQGLVAEFIQPAPEVLTLISVHAVQWDSRSSRGRLGTFTDRWEDFLSGAGPAPAVRPATKKLFAPGAAYQKGGR